MRRAPRLLPVVVLLLLSTTAGAQTTVRPVVDAPHDFVSTQPHPRWGFDLGLGGQLSAGLTVHIAGRLGWMFNDVWGVAWQLTVPLASIDDGPPGSTPRVGLMVSNAALVEGFVWRNLSVAAGPAAVTTFGALCVPGLPCDGLRVVPGVRAMASVTGTNEGGRARAGLAIRLQANVEFADDGVTFGGALTAGFEWY